MEKKKEIKKRINENMWYIGFMCWVGLKVYWIKAVSEMMYLIKLFELSLGI